jgi:hypothetical protein
MKGVYVIALTGHAIPRFSLGSHRIEFIDLQGLHAAVQRRSERPAMSESSLRTQHDIVAHLAERIDAVVPARFGALIEERELREILSARRQVVQDALSLVRGRVQMTVRFRDAPESMPRRRAPASRAMSGTAYLESKRAAEKMPPLVAVVTEAIGSLAIADRSQPATDRAPAVLYHLIARDSVAQYVSAVSKVKSPALGVSGPWPAFAFAPDLWS